MLNSIIRLALRERLLVLATSLLLLVLGIWQTQRMAIDVFSRSQPSAGRDHDRSLGNGARGSGIADHLSP